MKELKMIFNLTIVASLILAHQAYAGIVTGKINFNGTPPVPEKIDMAADAACAGSGQDVMTEDAIVNSDNTLRNVFVYVKQGLEGKAFPTPTTPVTIDQKSCHYIPHVFGIQVNQPLEIVNGDPTLHNIHALPTQSQEFNLGMPIQGMKLTKKFDKPEIMVKFKCDVHPWMHAYVGVMEHPYFSTSGETGTYEIKDLPAGTYIIEAWHEKFGIQTQNVTVDASGTQTVDFTLAEQ